MIQNAIKSATLKIPTVKVNYQKLKPDLVGKAIDCIGVSFATPADPFTRALGLSQAQWGVMAQMFVQRA